MYCRFCGQPNDEKHRFCQQCGQELKTLPPACRGCGHPSNGGEKFCRRCGMEIAGESAPVPRQQQGYAQPNPAAAPAAPKRPAASRWGRRVLAAVAVLILLIAGAVFLGDDKLGKVEIHAPSPQAAVNTRQFGPVIINQVGVMLKADAGRSDAERVAKALNGKIIGTIEFINFYIIETGGKTEADLAQAIAQAGQDAKVELAAPNAGVRFSIKVVGALCPGFDDIRYSGDKGASLKMTGVNEAWQILKASGQKLSGVNVGVVDNGFLNERNEFSGKVKIKATPNAELSEREAIFDANGKPTGRYYSYGSHGSAVARIIGSDSAGGGLQGTAAVLGDNLTMTLSNSHQEPYGYLVKPIKSADQFEPSEMEVGGKAWSFGAIAAIHDQVRLGAKVINMSFGPEAPSKANAAVSKAFRAYFAKMAKEYPDVLFVAAAGNEKSAPGKDEYWPGGINLPNVVTVGSVDNDGQISSFSNKASPDFEVTLSAPGRDTAVGINTDSGAVVQANGTSFAAPQVAAAAAVLKFLNPKLTAADVKKILAESAKGPNKVLAMDQAVLAVVNQLRLTGGQQALTMEQALALGKLDLVAEGSGKEWKVTTTVHNVPSGGAELEYSMQAAGSLGGASKEKIAQDGSLSRIVTLAADEGVLNVKRLDNGLCWQVRLKQADLAGTWRGSSTGVSMDTNTGSRLANTTDTITFVFKELEPGQTEYKGLYSISTGLSGMPVVARLQGDQIVISNSFSEGGRSVQFTWTANLAGEKMTNGTGSLKASDGKQYLNVTSRFELTKVAQ